MCRKICHILSPQVPLNIRRQGLRQQIGHNKYTHIEFCSPTRNLTLQFFAQKPRVLVYSTVDGSCIDVKQQPMCFYICHVLIKSRQLILTIYMQIRHSKLYLVSTPMCLHQMLWQFKALKHWVDFDSYTIMRVVWSDETSWLVRVKERCLLKYLQPQYYIVIPHAPCYFRT